MSDRQKKNAKQEPPKKNWCPRCDCRRRTVDGQTKCHECGAKLIVQPPYDDSPMTDGEYARQVLNPLDPNVIW